MFLHCLNNATVTNFLSDSIKNVSILYAESSKSFPWGRKTDVERFTNVLWTRNLEISNIEAYSVKTVSAKSIYFGENLGYWQLYVIYKGQSYKLADSSCEMTMNSICNEKDLKIYIQLDNSDSSRITATFEINNKTKTFCMECEAPIDKGIEISITNMLDSTITNLNVSFPQYTQSWINKTLNGDLEPKISFDNWKIEKEGMVKSTKRINFINFGKNYVWKFKFVYKKFCFHMNLETDTYMNLMSCDHGTTVQIIVLPGKDEDHCEVNFKFSDRQVKKTAMRICCLKEKLNIIKTLSVSFNSFIRDNFISHLNDFADLLIRISKEFYKTAPGYGGNASSPFFQQCEETSDQSTKVKIENVTLLVSAHFLTQLNASFVENLKEVVDSLNRLKSTWQEVNKQRKNLCNLLMEVIDPKYLNHQQYAKTIDYSIKILYVNLMRFNLMVAVKSSCEVLELSGFNEMGMTFCFPNFRSENFFVIEPLKLACYLKEEFGICRTLCFTVVEGNAILTAETHYEKVSRKSYKRGLDLFQMLQPEFIGLLEKAASETHMKSYTENISSIFFSSYFLMNIATLIVSHYFEIPFLTTLKHGFAKMNKINKYAVFLYPLFPNFSKSNFNPNTIDQWPVDLITTLQPFMPEETQRIFSEDHKAKQITYKEADFPERIVSYVFDGGLLPISLALIIGNILFNSPGLRLAGLIVPGLVLPMPSIIFKSINVARGGRCELGHKLEMQAIQLRERFDRLKLKLNE